MKNEGEIYIQYIEREKRDIEREREERDKVVGRQKGKKRGREEAIKGGIERERDRAEGYQFVLVG